MSETPTSPFPPEETVGPERARELGHELGLRGDEYDDLVEILGRVPTVAELGMYSVMWSEHCSYKSSKMHLRGLAHDEPWVIAGPGENAGVVDVGDGIAVAFKIESHNHPSYVEPFQGAATGVGGILRDIFTMGARPIAVMDPLRFGDPGGWTDGAGVHHEADALQRHLLDGVVRGVGHYGNCVGVPNIGGEVVFDDTYAGNPLTNVLAIGVLQRDKLQLARAEAPGHLAVLLGSATGRDGIGGASVLASQEFDEGLEAKRPNVQVGDPFAEKLLIECCLELYERDLVSGIQDMGAARNASSISELESAGEIGVDGDPFAEKLLIECCLELYERDLVSGIQDMGAAGIACSTSELASAASMGMDVDLDKVHLREPSMASWEILCSESQERMLALVAPEQLEELQEVAARWGVPATVIGEVVEGDALRLTRGGQLIADLPARTLAHEGPVYDRPQARPDWLDAYAEVEAETLDLTLSGGTRQAADGRPARTLEEAALAFLASPNVASKRWVFEQYDQHVRSGTVLGPGMGDAGVVRLPDSRRAVACATDGNGRWCELDPEEGTIRVVAEAFRNVACTGARPLATTNNLNFGNPERPEIMWQLATSIRALGAACRQLGVPVTGGNVSLYNETKGEAIHPTPVIGILGVLADAEDALGIAYEDDGELLLLLGAPTVPGLAGSEAQRWLGAPLGGRLAPADLEMEAALSEVLQEAAREQLVTSAHDVGAGGLLVTLAESCLAGDIGADVAFEGELAELSATQQLCSESPGRVVVTVPSSAVRDLAALCADAGVPIQDIGTVGGTSLTIRGLVDLDLDDLRAAYEGGLTDVLEG